MSKIKNGGLDQHGAGPFEQQQFRTSGIEGVKYLVVAVSGNYCSRSNHTRLQGSINWLPSYDTIPHNNNT